MYFYYFLINIYVFYYLLNQISSQLLGSTIISKDLMLNIQLNG